MATWRKLITGTMGNNNDAFDDVIYSTFKEGELDFEFDDGCGRENGVNFTLWTTNHVYFPICYDGAEWAGSAPRNPCDTALSHQGG